MDNTEKEKKKLKLDVPTANNAVGIRATLNNMGINNKSIGFDEGSGYVTINGSAFMKPTYMDDEAGVSYAPEKDIQKNVVDFYKNSSNPVVRVSDAYAAAAGQYGMESGGLSYGNGTVLIGGKPLDTMYIDDSGKAWARQGDVYELTNSYINSLNIENPRVLADRYAEKYLTGIGNSLDDIKNRNEFSYNPDNDPVYLAYKNKYMLEGDRASRNTMANYSALTGGYANSAAVTAGGLANQYYAKQLTDVIPDLAEQAYKRYYDSYMMDLNTVDKMLDLYDMDYTNAYKSNNQTIKNINSVADSVVARDGRAFEQNWTNKLNSQKLADSENSRYWDDILNEQKVTSAEKEIYWTDIINTLKAAGYDIENKSMMYDNEEKGIYLEYYRRFLESDLANDESQRAKQAAETYKYYYK